MVPTLREPLFCPGPGGSSLSQVLGVECKVPTKEKVWGRAGLMAEFCGTQGSIRLVPALRWSHRFEGCALGTRLPGS